MQSQPTSARFALAARGVDVLRAPRVAVLLALAALAACSCVCACLVLAPAPQARAASLDYGSLSREYETGGDPTAADSHWGYGAYQMLSDTAHDYAAWLAAKSNATYRSWGLGLQAAHKKDASGSNLYFNAMWRYVAGTKLSQLSSADKKRVKKVKKSVSVKAGSRAKALKLQYKFTVKTYYKPALKYWKKVAPGFKDTSYTLALRTVIFSIAVAAGPYGSAYNIFKPALATLGGWKKGMDEKTLITALYDERCKVVSKAPGSPAYKIQAADAKGSKYKALVGKYLKHYYSSSSAVQVAVYNRFRYNERSDALKLLSTCLSCTHAKTTGGMVTKSFSWTDTTHKETRTAKTCTICGRVIAKAGTYTAKNVFIMSGAKYRAASGRDYTVHVKGRYKVAASKAVLRTGAKTSAKARARIKKGAVVKVTKVKLGADGFWWGKATRGKKVGWTRLKSLNRLGTACAHSFKKGTCGYCGVTKAQRKAMAKIAKAVKKGTVVCMVTHADASYKAAYAVKSKRAKSLKKGARVKVKKVVTNLYGDWWAKLAGGGYVKLEALKLG